MTVQHVIVAIVAPTAETRDSITRNVEATQLATSKAAIDAYPAVEDDHPTQTLIEARPEIIIVDMQDQRAAIKSIGILRAVLPECPVYVCSSSSDPQLIIESMQAGAREFLPKPISARSLSLAFGRHLDEKNRHRAEKVRGKIYCVTSAKGGSGATSVAINLAVAVSQMPDTRVSLIDLNTPVGDVAAYLNIKTQFSVMDALSAAPRLDPVLLDTFMSKAHGVSLLAGTKKFQAGPAPTSASFAKLLRVLSQTFTHTFLDVPASLEPEQMQVITDVGESVLVVLTPELPALWRTHRLVLYLSGTGCADRMRLVINRDSKQYDLDQKEISRVLNYPIYWRLPNNYRSAIEAINTGKPIIFVNNSGLAKSYYRLAEDLTGVQVAAKKRGLSRFLFGGQ